MTARRYSRLASVEQKRNVKSAYLYSILSILAIVVLFFFGIPALVRFAGFIGTVGKSNKPVDVVDITPPAPPHFNDIPEFTNKENLDISGSSESGAVITITANKHESEVVANSDGQFNFTFNLSDGENTIKAKAKDTSGNESTDSDVYKITFDNKAPDLEITNPSDGASFYGSGQRQIQIKGTVSEAVDLTINERVVNPKDDGSFTFVTTLDEGENKFEVKAVDPSGNETSTSFTVSFTP